MAGTPGRPAGEQARLQEEDARAKGPALTSAIRIGAALVGTLIFAVAEPTELPVRDPSRARPVEINVRPAKPPERTPASAESVVAAEARRVAGDQPMQRARRSLQDHDDVEESDRTDREGREGDGSGVNGEFEGGSVERGHNIVTSTAGGDEPDGDQGSEADD